MKIVLLGPPGVGKGTMAVRLADHLNIPHISAGDLFRRHIGDKTELGVKAAEIIASGSLVPDALTIEMMNNRLSEPDIGNGYILDGYPRTIAQAEALESLSPTEVVIYFTADEDTIVARLSGRRVHSPSGRIYHVLFNPPRVPDRDDETGEALSIRPDDQEDAIRHRLSVYTKQTAPLAEFYRPKLLEVDAMAKPDEVFQRLLQALTNR